MKNSSSSIESPFIIQSDALLYLIIIARTGKKAEIIYELQVKKCSLNCLFTFHVLVQLCPQQLSDLTKAN